MGDLMMLQVAHVAGQVLQSVLNGVFLEDGFAGDGEVAGHAVGEGEHPLGGVGPVGQIGVVGEGLGSARFRDGNGVGLHLVACLGSEGNGEAFTVGGGVVMLSHVAGNVGQVVFDGVGL